jgi:DNA-binding protein H-NS
VAPTIEKSSLKEIEALMDRISKRKSALLHSRVESTRKKVVALVESMGLTLEDLFGAAPVKVATRSAAPSQPAIKKPASKAPAKSHKAKLPLKYSDPKDPSRGWSGHGKRPQWIVDAQQSGASLESLLIKANKNIVSKASGKTAGKHVSQTAGSPSTPGITARKPVAKAPQKVTQNSSPKKVPESSAAPAPKAGAAK